MDTFFDLALSIACHVFSTLWILTVSILSYWTRYRVSLASVAFPPSDEDDLSSPPPSVSPSPLPRFNGSPSPCWTHFEDVKRKGANGIDFTSPLSTPKSRRGSGRSVIGKSSAGYYDLYDSDSDSVMSGSGDESPAGGNGGGGGSLSGRRRHSGPQTHSHHDEKDQDSGPTTPPLHGSTPPRPLNLHIKSGSLGALAMVNRLNASNSFWIAPEGPDAPPMSPTGNCGGGATYPLESPFEINSPTGMEFPLFKRQETGTSRDREVSMKQRRNMRWLLCLMAVLRLGAAVPLVWMEAAGMEGPVSWWTMFISTSDLVALDLLIALMLAVAPIICVLVTKSFEMPRSFEHHVYYLSMILLVLPPLSTVRLTTLVPKTLTLLPSSIAGTSVGVERLTLENLFPPGHRSSLHLSVTILGIHRIFCPLISAVMMVIAREQCVGEGGFWKPMERKRWSRWAY